MTCNGDDLQVNDTRRGRNGHGYFLNETPSPMKAKAVQVMEVR
jgi:hypothetical protein